MKNLTIAFISIMTFFILQSCTKASLEDKELSNETFSKIKKVKDILDQQYEKRESPYIDFFKKYEDSLTVQEIKSQLKGINENDLIFLKNLFNSKEILEIHSSRNTGRIEFLIREAPHNYFLNNKWEKLIIIFDKNGEKNIWYKNSLSSIENSKYWYKTIVTENTHFGG